MKKFLIILLTSIFLVGCSNQNFDGSLESLMDPLFEGIDTSEYQVSSILRQNENEGIKLDTVEYIDILILMPFDDTEGESVILLKCEDSKETIKQIGVYLQDTAAIKSKGNIVLIANFHEVSKQNQILENFDKLF